MSNKQQKKSGLGGVRPGAGRKSEVKDARRVQVYLDAFSITTALALGKGNLSRGVREALRNMADFLAKEKGSNQRKP